jgi:hypothetical protein
MNRTVRLAVVLALSITAAACGKKKDDGGGAATAGGDDKPAAASLKMAKVAGLSIDVSGGAEVGDGMGDGVMLTGPEIGAMSVEVAKAAKTVDDVKTDAKDYSPQHLKDDKLADGFTVTWDNSGSAGANFFVEVWRTIGGKPIHCSSTVSKQSQADAVLAACKTIK